VRRPEVPDAVGARKQDRAGNDDRRDLMNPVEPSASFDCLALACAVLVVNAKPLNLVFEFTTIHGRSSGRRDVETPSTEEYASEDV
jgi:hypothetical protein